jgi:molecular chaperone DnaK (HSP70)
MAKVTSVGIDLGTTNSAVAHETRTGVDVLLNRKPERYTPSVVGLDQGGKVLVGSLAIDNELRNPENTIFSIKRLMGRYYDDPIVQEVTGRWGYRIVKAEEGDDVRVMLGDKSYSPVDISELILRRLKEDAEYRLNEPVTHAVITVPAYFSPNQRMATRDAGQQAGLHVKTILSEPAAAAMAYGVDHDPEQWETVLVYDLGGGTFDISILSIHGGGVYEQGIEGDMWLGGDDFDQAIARYVLEQIRRQFRHDPSDDKKFMVRLRTKAEKTKIALSEMSSATFSIDGAFALPSGSRPDVEVEVSRRQFEDLAITDGLIRFGIGDVDADEVRQWCTELEIEGKITDHMLEYGPDTVRNRIKKTRLLARKAIREAPTTKEEIHHVLMVGGSTAIPLVQQAVAEEFGAEKLMRNIDPMTCVAVGAGIAAERIQGIICQKDMEFNDLEAKTCQKCGAKLVAEKLCPDCGASNDLGAAKCANPDCEHIFKKLDISDVTGKPVAIHNADGEYELIVPKGTAFPTPPEDPIAVAFVVARDRDKTVRIPVYQAEQWEFDPEDPTQWLGSADIDVEGTPVLAGTRGDMYVRIDQGGCYHIDAIIQDGSGRRRTVHLNPYLREADSSRTAKWVRSLKYAMDLTEFIALPGYDWLISPEDRQTLERLLDEGKAAIDRNDEAAGTRIDREIRETTRGLVAVLVNGEDMRIQPALSLEMRGQIGTAIQELCAACRGHGDLQSAADRLNKLVAQAEAILPEDKRTSPGDVKTQA